VPSTIKKTISPDRGIAENQAIQANLKVLRVDWKNRLAKKPYQAGHIEQPHDRSYNVPATAFLTADNHISGLHRFNCSG
jgi:hypothetical protein